MSTSSPRFAPRATLVGLGLIGLLLVGNLVVSEWNLRRLVENGGRVLQAQEVLTTLEEVLARVTEAETAERGFLITDDPRYLQPYETAAARSQETLARLRDLMADDPEQQARTRSLQERMDVRLDELRQAVAARKAGGFDAARQAVSTNHGRRLMAEMRRLVTDMKEKEQEALARRGAESRRSAGLATLADRVGTAFGVGLVGLAVFLFRRDLALRSRAEEAALQLAAIVQSSEDAIISKTLDGTVLSWNPGAEHVYGYRAGEMIGRPITLLCPPEHFETMARDLDRVGRGEHVAHFEASRVRRGGQRIDVSLRISPLKDAAGRVVGASAIARDITEYKALQREVLEIAAREQRRIGQDLHDGIGQQLTGLAMMAQRLVEVLSRKGLPEVASAAKLEDGLEHALRQVRALSKGLVPVEVDSEGLMAALADLAARTRELDGVDCRFECREPVPVPDNQAATNLYRLSQEALTNALKHGRARTVIIRLAAEGDLVRLSVADDGVGFADAPAAVAGTGLRIMRYRAELIGARLTIEPAVPHGAVISCTLARR